MKKIYIFIYIFKQIIVNLTKIFIYIILISSNQIWFLFVLIRSCNLAWPFYPTFVAKGFWKRVLSIPFRHQRLLYTHCHKSWSHSLTKSSSSSPLLQKSRNIWRQKQWFVPVFPDRNLQKWAPFSISLKDKKILKNFNIKKIDGVGPLPTSSINLKKK